MLKSIPKSNISNKRFPVYKEWLQTNVDVPVIEAFNEEGEFNPNTSTKVDGLYISPLYNSTRAKYYTSDGNVFTQHGIVKSAGAFSRERIYSDIVQIIRIPQIKFGEQIKKGSVHLEDLDNDNIYVDDGFGSIVTISPVYDFVSYDVETQLLIFNDGVDQYDIILSQFDVNTGIGTFTFDGDTDSNVVVLELDFQVGLIRFSERLNIGGLDMEVSRLGNIFYDEGIIVLPNSSRFTNYRLNYRSTMTIHETEILVSVDKGEFNYSQNPTAVDVSVFQTYDFNTTAISNIRPAGKVRITEVNDISRTPHYFGSIGSVTGSWNDYDESGSADPTGSYLAPFITTIGLYDKNQDLVAVAKLPKPIKNLPDYSVNFIIRLDT